MGKRPPLGQKARRRPLGGKGRRRALCKLPNPPACRGLYRVGCCSVDAGCATVTNRVPSVPFTGVPGCFYFRPSSYLKMSVNILSGGKGPRCAYSTGGGGVCPPAPPDTPRGQPAGDVGPCSPAGPQLGPEPRRRQPEAAGGRGAEAAGAWLARRCLGPRVHRGRLRPIPGAATPGDRRCAGLCREQGVAAVGGGLCSAAHKGGARGGSYARPCPHCRPLPVFPVLDEFVSLPVIVAQRTHHVSGPERGT